MTLTLPLPAPAVGVCVLCAMWFVPFWQTAAAWLGFLVAQALTAAYRSRPRPPRPPGPASLGAVLGATAAR